MDRQSRARSGVVVEFPSGRLLPFPGEGPEARQRRGRRLADRILVAVHLACDQGELETADALLRCAEMAVANGRGRRDGRADDARLIAAFERIWFLRFAEAAPPALTGGAPGG
jgi:hypothetical protein